MSGSLTATAHAPGLGQRIPTLGRCAPSCGMTVHAPDLRRRQLGDHPRPVRRGYAARSLADDDRRPAQLRRARSAAARIPGRRRGRARRAARRRDRLGGAARDAAPRRRLSRLALGAAGRGAGCDVATADHPRGRRAADGGRRSHHQHPRREPALRARRDRRGPRHRDDLRLHHRRTPCSWAG